MMTFELNEAGKAAFASDEERNGVAAMVDLFQHLTSKGMMVCKADDGRVIDEAGRDTRLDGQGEPLPNERAEPAQNQPQAGDARMAERIASLEAKLARLIGAVFPENQSAATTPYTDWPVPPKSPQRRQPDDFSDKDAPIGVSPGDDRRQQLVKALADELTVRKGDFGATNGGVARESVHASVRTLLGSMFGG
jgi:hypothetical protein